MVKGTRDDESFVPVHSNKRTSHRRVKFGRAGIGQAR